MENAINKLIITTFSILIAIISLLIFYGTMCLALIFLPKWVDFIIGVPFSFYMTVLFLIDVKKIYNDNSRGNRNCREF